MQAFLRLSNNPHPLTDSSGYSDSIYAIADFGSIAEQRFNYGGADDVPIGILHIADSVADIRADKSFFLHYNADSQRVSIEPY